MTIRSHFNPMKRCFKCLRDLPVEAFYRHPQMADGRLSKCSDCAKADVRQNREARIDEIRAYDRERSKLPHRMEMSRRVHASWEARNPERAKAQQTASNATRDGKLARVSQCEGCGTTKRRVERHHPDYSKPLLVLWLCKPCHAIADKIRRRLETA